ncbi:MAG: HNH endonuclease [Rhizobiaceae bacterium]
MSTIEELAPNPGMPEKLSALRQMLRHLPSSTALDDQGFAYCAASMVVIMDAASTNYQRGACSAILDYIFPEWKDRVSVAALGAVAERRSSSVRKWRDAVLHRDGYQCVECGSEDGLEAHHVVRWADDVFLRVEPSNGKTLCKRCHLSVHGRLH